MAIKVTVEQDRMGNIIGRPVSDKWARRFARVVRENGGGASDTFFFQEGGPAAEFLEDMPARQRRDLNDGWPVTFLADPWVVGHWYGYDAYTAAE